MQTITISIHYSYIQTVSLEDLNQKYKGVSLIAGMEYGMKQWSGLWNGQRKLENAVLQASLR